MKRVVASLLIGLFLTGLAAAQSAGLRSFRQIGAATSELNTDQLIASHPSLSMGTQLKVTNTANGKEVIVTVTGRIPASGTRIVDLSRAAAARLAMNASGTTPVTIEVLRNTELAAAAPEPEPEPEPYFEEKPVVIAREEPKPEPVREEPKVQEEKPKKEEPVPAPAPAPITIYNTITVEARAPEVPAPAPESVAAPEPAAPAQVIPVIAAPAFRAVPGPAIAAAQVYYQAVVPVRAAPCPPAVAPQVLAAPVKVLVTPIQPQAPCPPAQASAAYSAPPQIVCTTSQAYRQVQPQQAQPQASYQQTPAPQPPVTVYTTPSAPRQAPVTVYTAPAPAAQAPAVVYAPQSSANGPAAAIKPRMPDPASQGLYRVQVGSYADPQNAQAAAEFLVRMGLSPAYEQYGKVWRVVLPGIRAQQLTAVAQQLGAMGIGEAWIRKEG